MRNRLVPIFYLFLILGCTAKDPTPSHFLIGQSPPDLVISQWVGSPPLNLKDLKGQVVLIRFWTDTCPYCSRSMPSLNFLQKKYGDRGLQVLGIFHPKPAGPVTGERIQRAVDIFKITFPIGVDADWTNLKRWWLDRDASNWTSVSFLLDREGKVAHIHPGGDYYLDPENPENKSHQDYLKLVEAIEKGLVAKGRWLEAGVACVLETRDWTAGTPK